MTKHGSRSGFPDLRLAQAKAAREEQLKLLEKLRNAGRVGASAAPNANSADQASTFSAALRGIRLRPSDDSQTLAPSENYCQIAEAIERTVATGISQSVLCWPAPNASIAAGFAFAVLAKWQDCGQDGNNHLAAPPPLRAIHFPWSRHVRQPLANMYVCKSYIHALHKRHLQRYGEGRQGTDGLYDLHVSLIRVSDLNGWVTDGECHPEYQNPTLQELIPGGSCDANDAANRTGLLHRVRSKTLLKNLSSSRQAEDPKSAPYYLYSARANDSPRVALSRLPSKPHVLLLDLTKAGRGRFGDDWRLPVKQMLAGLRTYLPDVPVLAVTDDPWVHRQLIWKFLKEHDKVKGDRPAKESALFFRDRSLTSPVDAGVTCAGASEIKTRSFSGKLDAILKTLGELKSRAATLEDLEADKQLGELALLLKRCANLPGGVSDLGDYVAAEAGDLRATHIMSAYQVPSVIANIDRLEGALAQSRKGPLAELCRNAREVWNNHSVTSPMSVLLADVLRQYVRNSSKTVVIFRKQMLCDYAVTALSSHPEIGEAAAKRIENGMWRFVDEVGWRETTSLPPSERHQTTTVILVCPTRLQLLGHMTDPWLPRDVVVLADAATLGAIARDAHQLARYPAFRTFEQRLGKLRDSCDTEVEKVTGHKVILDREAAPPADVEFPTARVIDLSGGAARTGQDTVIKLETDDSQTILARRKTKLVSFDGTTAVPTYKPLLAHNAEVNDDICVISDDFVDMARTKLDITHVASEEMRDYHQLVAGLYARRAGTSDREKRRELAAEINRLRTATEAEVSEETVRYWVDLEKQLAMPLDEVTPHAPKQFETFLRFMRALGVSQILAERYWHWAVIHTRSHRLKAAHQLHEAYLGVLISPHAAEADNPKRVADIRALRASAQSFVSRIRAKSQVERASLCA